MNNVTREEIAKRLDQDPLTTVIELLNATHPANGTRKKRA
jgi:hypothetical protein